MKKIKVTNKGIIAIDKFGNIFELQKAGNWLQINAKELFKLI